jgi:large subunit ribosomal protein L18
MKKIVHDPRLKRKVRIRKKVRGTEGRPRLSVFRSNKHIYAQIIDDVSGRVLVSASSVDKECREKMKKGPGIDIAKGVGTAVAERAMAKQITQVVFDRNGYLYHGRVKALADAAREKGLQL